MVTPLLANQDLMPMLYVICYTSYYYNLVCVCVYVSNCYVFTILCSLDILFDVGVVQKMANSILDCS